MNAAREAVRTYQKILADLDRIEAEEGRRNMANSHYKTCIRCGRSLPATNAAFGFKDGSTAPLNNVIPAVRLSDTCHSCTPQPAVRPSVGSPINKEK